MKIFLAEKKRLCWYILLLGGALLSLLLLPKKTAPAGTEPKDRLLPVYRVERGEEKVCALTFDAAWGDEDTDKLLAILEKEQIKATFFVVGTWAEKYPKSVKKFYDAGHEIMNHSMTHPHIEGLSREKLREEIVKCDDVIKGITGERPSLFRGPYGEYNNMLINLCAETGHTVLQWDVDSLDWKDVSEEQIVTRVLKRVKPGSVILLHNGAVHTPGALEKIIPALKEKGYTFLPATKLLLTGETEIDNTGKQIPA